MKKIASKKLTLSRDTLRVLTPYDLGQVAGGAPSAGPVREYPTDPVPWVPAPILVTVLR